MGDLLTLQCEENYQKKKKVTAPSPHKCWEVFAGVFVNQKLLQLLGYQFLKKFIVTSKLPY